MKYIFESFSDFLNNIKPIDEARGATPRFLKSAGGNLARQVKGKKNYTEDELKDRLLSMPIAKMLSDDEILTVLDHAKDELGLNESASNDISWALKSIKKYNKSSKGSNADIEDLAIDIIKNLGYKAVDSNVSNVMNHLIDSSDGDDNIPEDKTLIKELYPLLESVNPNGIFIRDNNGRELHIEKKDVNKYKRGKVVYATDEDGEEYEVTKSNTDIVSESATNESRVQYKRRYTESHPAKIFNSNTKIRTKVLSAVSDKTLTEDELKGLLKELNANPRWFVRNSNLFKVTENGISLSGTGKKMSKHIIKSINEEDPITESVVTSTEDAVKHIIKNYKDITGTKYNRKEVPDSDIPKIERFLKKNKINVDEFWAAWLKYSL